MLEKIGLPAKPSLRGSNWVADASQCQGCSSPFTFINRKHHCRRCGGIYCSSCTQQRMVLRGQGDSPVRICEPCKKLEEAARFELRHGHTTRSGRGSSRSMSKQEDEISSKVLGNERELFSSGLTSKNDAMSSMQRSTSGASCSNAEEEAVTDERELPGNHSADESVTPEELRQKASDEKKMYRILKGRGKSAEALRAFKRGKELERQADALELNLRKTHKKASPPGKLLVVQNENSSKESVGKNKVEKDDLASELRELGWSDLDIREDDKKPANMSLEGELFSLLGEASQNRSKSKGSVDTTRVVAHKRKALTLKREGKLAEAKEELKKAKLLEKQIEEQAFLAEAEDSDDELSALIRSMDSHEQDNMSIGYEQKNQLDFDHLLVAGDDLGGIDNNFEVTDKDMEDPEIAAALESLGWNEDNNHPEPVAFDREAVLSEILSLKKEALSNKRTGNVAEAMEHLRKAKALERDLESFDSQENKASLAPETLLKSVEVDDENVNVAKNANAKDAPKSRIMIQKELLGLKKKALALRREGKSDEAEEELKKGKVLELQLEEIDNATKVNAKPVNFNTRDISTNLPIGDGEDDVTDRDLQDPTYLSLLSNLGWKEEDSDHVTFPSQSSKENNQARPSRRKSKSEMQRELLNLKRKTLALKRQGEFEEAEDVLSKVKAIEAEMEEMEAPKLEVQFRSETPIRCSLEEEDKIDVTEEDMNDPTLNNLGWKDEQHKPLTMQSEPSEQISHSSSSSINPSSAIAVEAPRSKGEIQRELLALKRKALALRRKGETEEAEELLRMSKALESQIEEMDAPKQVLLDGYSSDKHVSLGPLRSMESVASSHPPSGSMPITDLLTGEDWIRAAPSADSLQEKQSFVSESSLTSTPIQLGSSLKVSSESRFREGQVLTKKIEEKVQADERLQVNEVQVISSPNNQSSLRHEILTRKRKAVALKREGKLAEAREELRQAKLLEKNLDEDNSTSVSSSHVASVSTSAVTSVGQKEQVPPISLPKPLSGRDRFKLQQQSLSHKRQAMKLRREGRMEEAETEFELAKTLENRLEQSQDSTKSGGAVDDVVVEDLLDPELLSALNAIGMGGASAVPEKPEPAKLDAVKSESSNQERIQLEERIKAEKVKAVNLKRSGRQAEALDALRRAKQLEKKVNALV